MRPALRTLFVLPLAFLVSGAAYSATATMDFVCDVGRLDLGNLTASGNRAVFPAGGTTMLNDGTGQQETSGGTVTINMQGFRPLDVAPAGLAIVITDGSTTVTATVVDAPLPFVLLDDGQGNLDSVEFFGPNSPTNFMTLVYTASSDTVRLTIVGFGGNTATLTGVAMGAIQMGVSATSSAANFDDITFQGPGIPLFPPVFDPNNPWVDFSVPPCGNGAQSYPFDLLDDARDAANPDATISIVPGTDSTETFTGVGVLDTAMFLVNSDPGSGSVSIGVAARRSVEVDPAKSGFISSGRRRGRR